MRRMDHWRHLRHTDGANSGCFFLNQKLYRVWRGALIRHVDRTFIHGDLPLQKETANDSGDFAVVEVGVGGGIEVVPV